MVFSGIAVMTTPTNGLPVLSSVVSVPTDPKTSWGNALTSDSKYDYIYGWGAYGATSAMKVARVPIGQSLTASDWQYWNGTIWVSGETAAIDVPTENELTGVTEASGGGYVAVSIPNSVYTDSVVDLSYACNPQGPWSTPATVYTVPEISQYGNEIAYIPTFHNELAGSNGLVVSYNVNSLSGLSALRANIHQYQPRFLYIK